MISKVEKDRLLLQSNLDAQKTQTERNVLGQFATPTSLATELLMYAKQLFADGEKIRFLDPAIGTGSFYSALSSVFKISDIKEALGYEIDPHYAIPAVKLWDKTKLKIEVKDYTKQKADPRFNLIICNPPYVRHHHIKSSEKTRLQSATHLSCGIPIGGLSGLYCYFLGLAHAWLAPNGISAWLIPSEFMDVNYGGALKEYLLNRVTLLHIHRFDPTDTQFSDALVSSAIVWFKNSAPPSNHKVRFTFGGSLLIPQQQKYIDVEALRVEKKWTRFPGQKIRDKKDVPVISTYFDIRRGLATGNNKFFILSRSEIQKRELPLSAFKPILPSSRYLLDDEIQSRKNGYPILDKELFLLDTTLTESQMKKTCPALLNYIEEGKALGVHKGYLCSHRTPWYSQEKRAPAPIVCTYLGRSKGNKRPFRFILNRSKATITNVYLAMYPKGDLAEFLKAEPQALSKICDILNRIPLELLLGEGRVYGGGLHKLEPKELGNVPLQGIEKIISKSSFIEAA